MNNWKKCACGCGGFLDPLTGIVHDAPKSGPARSDGDDTAQGGGAESPPNKDAEYYKSHPLEFIKKYLKKQPPQAIPDWLKYLGATQETINEIFAQPKTATQEAMLADAAERRLELYGFPVREIPKPAPEPVKQNNVEHPNCSGCGVSAFGLHENWCPKWHKWIEKHWNVTPRFTESAWAFYCDRKNAAITAGNPNCLKPQEYIHTSAMSDRRMAEHNRENDMKHMARIEKKICAGFWLTDAEKEQYEILLIGGERYVAKEEAKRAEEE
jgi:hypothetical protein